MAMEAHGITQKKITVFMLGFVTFGVTRVLFRYLKDAT
jgi:hypothetical protein